MSPATARRLLLTACVLGALLAGGFLGGCAQYEIRRPMAESGTVLITWEVNPARVPGNHCGWAEQIARGHYHITFRRAYDVNDLCVAHEAWHFLGGSHK